MNTITREQHRQHKALLSRFSLKSLSCKNGPDGEIISAKVFIDNVLIDTFNDPGTGGGAYPVNFNSAGGKRFMDFFNTSELRERVIGVWDFYTLDEITPDIALGFLVNSLITEKEKNNIANKHLSFFDESGNMVSIRFKKVSKFADLLKFKNGVEVLQRAYNENAVIVQKTEQLFVTPASTLQSMGIIVDPSLHL